MRPYAREFLERMSRVFELTIYTASISEYADPIIDYLDPRKTLISQRLYREHCTKIKGILYDLCKVLMSKTLVDLRIEHQRI